LTVCVGIILEIDMQNCKNMRIQSISPVCLLGASIIFLQPGQAATSAWSVDLTFDAFAGNSGGFADATTLADTIRDQQNAGSVTRAYDVVESGAVNSTSGQPTYALGQDGITDFTIKTTLVDGSDGRWNRVAAEQRRNTLRMNSVVDVGASKPGDFAIVAFEVSFSSALGLSADQLSIRLASANGSGQLYEWSMITVGGIADAPFSIAQVGNYNHQIYNQGNPEQSGNGDALSPGRSISQYLAGAAASPTASGGAVANGWWSIDDFNAQVPNGDESFGVTGGDGRIDDNQTVTGNDLGLTGQPLSSFTVWFGLHDVAFDTNGDGFTLTEGTPSASFNGFSFGTTLATVPEPSVCILMLGTGALMLRRRR
jgi:hypothetical protein